MKEKRGAVRDMPVFGDYAGLGKGRERLVEAAELQPSKGRIRIVRIGKVGIDAFHRNFWIIGKESCKSARFGPRKALAVHAGIDFYVGFCSLSEAFCGRCQNSHVFFGIGSLGAPQSNGD